MRLRASDYEEPGKSDDPSGGGGTGRSDIGPRYGRERCCTAPEGEPLVTGGGYLLMVPSLVDKPMPTDPVTPVERPWLAGCIVHQTVPYGAPARQVLLNGRHS